jgi:hypothetical protein
MTIAIKPSLANVIIVFWTGGAGGIPAFWWFLNSIAFATPKPPAKNSET